MESPWKKFEGTVDEIPCFVKTIDGKFFSVTSQDGLDHAVRVCGAVYIDYYMTVPPLPEGK